MTKHAKWRIFDELCNVATALPMLPFFFLGFFAVDAGLAASAAVAGAAVPNHASMRALAAHMTPVNATTVATMVRRAVNMDPPAILLTVFVNWPAITSARLAATPTRG